MSERRFVGGSYELNARKADVQRAVNLCPVVAEVAGAKSVAYLDSVPGLTTFSFPDDMVRITEDSEYRFTLDGELRLLA